MTRAYRGWCETSDGRVEMGTVPWTKIVPPGWQGFCVHCRRRLTAVDWQEGRVAAAGDGDPWHCLCISHLDVNRPEYRDALNALARAVAGA